VREPSCELRLAGYPNATTTTASTAPLYWIPVGLVAGMIFSLSSTPTPEMYLSFLQWAVGDKMAHAMEYGALSILCYRAFRHGSGSWASRHAFVLAVLASAAYGMTDEWHQYFVPSRSADGLDLFADTVGAISVLVGWRQIVE
jgi:hypothetical protein